MPKIAYILAFHGESTKRALSKNAPLQRALHEIFTFQTVKIRNSISFLLFTFNIWGLNCFILRKYAIVYSIISNFWLKIREILANFSKMCVSPVRNFFPKRHSQSKGASKEAHDSRKGYLFHSPPPHSPFLLKGAWWMLIQHIKLSGKKLEHLWFYPTTIPNHS